MQQISSKRVKARHDWVCKVIYRELCKTMKFDHTSKWYMHNQESVLENNMHKILWDFEIQTDHLISVRRPDLVIVNKNKRICRIVDFVVLVDHSVRLKENEKKNKYLDLARELKKLWDVKVTVIPIVIVALSRVIKGLIQRLEDFEIRGGVEIFQTTALLRSTRILRRVLETWGDFMSLKLQWKTIG